MPRARSLKKLKVYWGYKTIRRDQVVVKKDLLAELCKNNCKHYGRKLSCPPFAPQFESVYPKLNFMTVIWTGFSPSENKGTYWRAMNKVTSTMTRRILRSLSLPALFNASCGRCRACKAKDPSVACKGVEYSLESTGVDCNELFKLIEGRDLEWYAQEYEPTLIVAMGCIFLSRKEDSEVLIKKLPALIEKEKLAK